jgi:hypothetical protein
MMVKTVWHCDDCGAAFNSRAARLYHRNHTCPKIKDAEEKTEGKEDLPDDFTTGTEIKQTGGEGDGKVTVAKSADAGTIDAGETQTAIDEQRELGTGYLIVSDSEDTTEKDEIPMIFIIPVILVIAFVAIIILFRDKILSFIRRPPQPPTGISNLGFV